MGLGDFLRKQFIDVIDWVDEPGVLAFRYPMQDREIQNGAKLTVREAQAAAFLNEGKMADILGPGLHTLNTQTLPILTNLMNWDKAFNSPFKSDVFFFSLREQIDRKWGLAQPITVRDKDFGAIRVRAFGLYSFAIGDPRLLWQTVVGNLGRFTTDDIESQLRGVIVTSMATLLGGSEVAFLDMAAQQSVLSQKMKEAAAVEFARLGLTLKSFMLESLSLPEEVQARIDAQAGVRALGDIDKYARVQAADSIKIAAANEGGLAGLGATAAAGLSMGQMMAAGLGAGMVQGQNQAQPQPAAAPAEDPFVLIEKLHKLVEMGAISQEEFDTKKTALLAKIG